MRRLSLLIAGLLTAALPLAAWGQVSIQLGDSQKGCSEKRLGATRFFACDKLIVDSATEEAGDLYGFSSFVAVRGAAAGDLSVFAATTNLSGSVAGDINAFSEQVTIEGDVGDDVRVFAKTLNLRGSVGGDVIAFAAAFNLAPSSEIRGGVLVNAGEVLLEGRVVGPAEINGAAVTLAGSFEGDVSVDCDELTIEPGFNVAGNLVYSARNAVDVPEGAVSGTVEQREKKKEEKDSESSEWFVFSPEFRVLLRIYLAVIALVAGTLFVLFFQPFVDGALRHSSGGTGLVSSFGIGLVSLLVSLVLGLVCFVVLPLSLGILSAMGALLYFGSLLGKMIVGRMLLRPLRRRAPHALLALLAGVVVCLVLDFIPVIGELTWLFFTVAGAGAALYQLRSVIPETPPPPPPPAPAT